MKVRIFKTFILSELGCFLLQMAVRVKSGAGTIYEMLIHGQTLTKKRKPNFSLTRKSNTRKYK